MEIFGPTDACVETDGPQFRKILASGGHRSRETLLTLLLNGRLKNSTPNLMVPHAESEVLLL